RFQTCPYNNPTIPHSCHRHPVGAGSCRGRFQTCPYNLQQSTIAAAVHLHHHAIHVAGGGGDDEGGDAAKLGRLAHPSQRVTGDGLADFGFHTAVVSLGAVG